MTTEELNKFIDGKWKNYSWGLAIGVSLREDKSYTLEDIKNAFSAGTLELMQVLYHNNIDVDKMNIDVE